MGGILPLGGIRTGGTRALRPLSPMDPKGGSWCFSGFLPFSVCVGLAEEMFADEEPTSTPLPNLKLGLIVFLWNNTPPLRKRTL